MIKSLVTALLLYLTALAHGQTVITAGGVYPGITYTQPVIVQTSDAVVFWNCKFIGSGRLLSAALGSYAQIIVEDCSFSDGGQHGYGDQAPQGIWVTTAQKLWIWNTTFNNLSVDIMADGVRPDGSRGYTDLFISSCAAQHNNVRYADGYGGWLNQSGWGVAICIMHTIGWNPTDQSWHTIVTGCTLTNTLGVDEPADGINLYESSNVIVSNNQITGHKGFYGQFAVNANGIVTDDQWSDDPSHRGYPGDANYTTSNCLITGNVLTNCAIGVWAGHDNQITNNTIKNTGKLSTGSWCPAYIIGIGRYAPEGQAWAQTNIVTSNTVSSLYLGQPDNYNDQCGGLNWSANSSF